MSQDDFIARGISQTTFYNYVNWAEAAGLVVRLKNDKDRPKRTTGARLTDKGSELLGRGLWGAITRAEIVPKADNQTPSPREEPKSTRTEIELLEESTDVTDRFNNRSSHWKWVLVRKEETMKQTQW